MSSEEISGLVESAMKELSLPTISRQEMGIVIKWVKERAGDRADGALIARAVNERIKV